MKKLLLIILAALLLFLLRPQIIGTTKSALFLANELPQSPIKPLDIFSKDPIHQRIEFESNGRKIVADLLIPQKNSHNKKPGKAIIIAMGVKTLEKDKPRIIQVSQTLSRLGYVVLWPRSESLDQGVPGLEDPAVFIESFKYLRNLDEVDDKKISFLGFSVGSSIAFVASADPQIASEVKGLVFFGGYFDLADYIVSLSANTAAYDSQTISWSPSTGATSHFNEITSQQNYRQLEKILKAREKEQARKLLEELPSESKKNLERLSPSKNLQNFQARIFILHDKGDSFVPYTESINLSNALGDKVPKTFLITNLFEHVQPRADFKMGTLVEIFNLFKFSSKALYEL